MGAVQLAPDASAPLAGVAAPGENVVVYEITSAHVVLAACTLFGLLIRVITLHQFSGTVDEPASLLAAVMVSQKGLPLFPSDVLYLQGAVISYLGAPLAWILGPNQLLWAMRVLVMVFSLPLIPLGMLLIKRLTGNLVLMAFVGVLLACDPNAVLWSISIRPYGLLMVEVVAAVYLFIELILSGHAVRLLHMRVTRLLPIVVWIGTFTHIGFWLIAPPLVVLALLTWGKSLLDENRAILNSGLISGASLVPFFLLGRFVGSGSGTGDSTIGKAFVGSHLFDIGASLHHPQMTWSIWTNNFRFGAFHQGIPLLIAFASGILLQFVATVTPGRRLSRTERIALVVCPTVLWVVMLLVTGLVHSEGDPRYLSHVVPLAYVVLTLGAFAVWTSTASLDHVARRAARIVIVVALLFPSVAFAADAAHVRSVNSGPDPNYMDLTEWASEHVEPGDVVISSLPPAEFFYFDIDSPNVHLYFLAGAAGSSRVAHYEKTGVGGQAIDYWLGLPVLDSVPSLCATMRHQKGNVWFITDSPRIHAKYSYAGDIETIMTGALDTMYRGVREGLVMQVMPIEQWSSAAVKTCKHAT